MENKDKASLVVFSPLILALGSIAYLVWEHWLFLAAGIIGFVLVFTSSK